MGLKLSTAYVTCQRLLVHNRHRQASHLVTPVASEEMAWEMILLYLLRLYYLALYYGHAAEVFGEVCHRSAYCVFRTTTCSIQKSRDGTHIVLIVGERFSSKPSKFKFRNAVLCFMTLTFSSQVVTCDATFPIQFRFFIINTGMRPEQSDVVFETSSWSTGVLMLAKSGLVIE